MLDGQLKDWIPGPSLTTSLSFHSYSSYQDFSDVPLRTRCPDMVVSTERMPMIVTTFALSL